MQAHKHSPQTNSIQKIPDSVIQQWLDKICSSQEFAAKDKTRRFLRYLVDETLAERGENLKQYTIGIGVFERRESFNPALDPVVRVQAGRLRRSLELYYGDEGKEDSVRIVIPKGSYVPIFFPQRSDASQNNLGEKTETGIADIVRPAILVLPLQNLTGNPENDYFAEGFSEELIIELSRYEDYEMISAINISRESALADMRERAGKTGAHFAIGGSIRKDDRNVKVAVKVVDLKTGRHIWGEQYSRDLTADNLITIQEQIVRQAISNLASEFGIIPQKISQDSRRKPTTDLKTYEAIFRFYYNQTRFTAETFMSAFSALEQAVKRDPDCGIASAMLGHMYVDTFGLDLPGNQDALERAGELIERAVIIEPANQLVRIISAVYYFHLNNRELFSLEMEKARRLNPNSPLRFGAIGFYLALYGNWEEGKKLLDQMFKKNIDYPSWLHGATTLYYYRQNDYGRAYQEAIQYAVPGLFWAPMLRAACLGQLGRQTEAKEQITHLLELKPDFKEKARMLIQRYVKETELVEHVIEGLEKAGLKS